MQVSILGWYNHGNVGDEAFKIAFPRLLPQAKVRCVETISADTLEPDAIILGGGDIVYPAFTDMLRSRPQRKIAASVTLTEKSDLGFLPELERVYVRDHLSLRVAAGHKNVSYLPDATFVLEPNREAGRNLLSQMFSRQGHELREKVVVVVMSSYVMYTDDKALRRDAVTYQFLVQNLGAIADATDASFVFLSFGMKAPSDDRASNGWVGQHCMKWDKNLVVYPELNVQQTLNVVAAADVVVSTRFHATVFSVLSAVPFIDLTHHDKNLGFIETVGRLNCSIPLWEFSVNRFRDLLWESLGKTWPDQYLLEFTKRSKEQLNATTLL